MSDDVTIPNPGYPHAGSARRRPGRYGRAHPGMSLDTRRLMLFAGGLGAILVSLIGASTLVGHRDGPVPVVTADSRPIRVRPQNPGGMQIDGAENDVFSTGIDDDDAKLAPAAEVPDPNGLRVPSQAQAAAAVAPQLAPFAAAAAETVLISPPSAPPGAAKLAASAAAVAAVVPTPAVPAGPAAASEHRAIADSAASGHVQQAATAHGATVQLAALTTEQAAREEWQQLSRRMPDLLSGRQPSFSRIDHDGRTFWRVRMVGFSDIAQARVFCEQVRLKGGACSVADF